MQRRLQPPDGTFLLLGPRAAGKSTWLRQAFPQAERIDLLHAPTYRRLLTEPEAITGRWSALPDGAWVVIDEVQKLPSLLDEVHRLTFERQHKLRFALSGSSARKLKGGQANLLAGRAEVLRFFPTVMAEFGADVAVDDVLAYGCLPRVRVDTERRRRLALLDAYVTTYLAEEIRAEALVRGIEGFARFLEVASLMNGQVTNLNAIARDAGVARATVGNYFEVLVDTLLAAWLPAWRPHARVKETGHPKFYLFDCGVARALTRRQAEPLSPEERGPLLETWVFHELRAFAHDAGLPGALSYWRTPSGVEVDFIWEGSRRRVGIEVKATPRWRPEFLAGLAALESAQKLDAQFVVTLGPKAMKFGKVWALPVKEFLNQLYRGEVL